MADKHSAGEDKISSPVPSVGRVLVVAGSDSGGGAGIQADIKAITAMGSFAATAITALTAQNTHGVHGVLPIATEFIAAQMECVLDDIGADVIKSGMLFSPEVIELVTQTLAQHAPEAKWVLDPVMVAKGGARLLQAEAEDCLRSVALPRAHLITPNIPEAEILSQLSIETVADMRAAGEVLLNLGPRAVLMKGGHLRGEIVHDLLIDASGCTEFEHSRVSTSATHGTGCTLASAIAAGVAQGKDLAAAVRVARYYVLQSMASAPRIGGGHGPLNHGWNAQRIG